MNIRNTLVNEYTVGGSLLLVGFGFFSTRFADVLSYQVTTVPSMIPVVGGASVTVGRILGIVPATLGLAVLFRKAKDVPVVSEATQLPIVKTVVEYVEDLSDEMGGTIETTPAIVMDLSAEELAAEQAMFCSECTMITLPKWGALVEHLKLRMLTVALTRRRPKSSKRSKRKSRKSRRPLAAQSSKHGDPVSPRLRAT